MQKKDTTKQNAHKPVQKDIPSTPQQRKDIARLVKQYVDSSILTPPVSLAELKTHAEKIIQINGLSSDFVRYIVVLINNQLWHPTVIAIPYNKRLLLLPQCLRDKENCQGRFDNVGLICTHCGSCIIDDLKTQAEELGYAVLIAEGSPVVMSLIETGKIEAVIGVSCLTVLERVFPYMEAAAVPGIAIPLLNEGCQDTTVDLDDIFEAIYENSTDQSSRLNLKQLQHKVQSWFTRQSLESTLGPAKSHVEEIALNWLSAHGKRWRPFLTACTFQALNGSSDKSYDDILKEIAIAVECFHKASLIHDDIEDNDAARYGDKTLHTEFGIPIALNIGDFLLGVGYRLLSQLQLPDRQKAVMLTIASQGHTDLCIGQGQELAWMHSPGPLTIDYVIEIFRKKTAPAFEVALKLGAVLADSDKKLHTILKSYSDALGIAYQIRDDIEDFNSQLNSNDSKPPEPSLLYALAYEKARDNDKLILESLWSPNIQYAQTRFQICSTIKKLDAEEVALQMLNTHKLNAVKSLSLLDNANLKGLLRRVLCKIFNDHKVMGCCNDYQAGHDDRRRQG